MPSTQTSNNQSLKQAAGTDLEANNPPIKEPANTDRNELDTPPEGSKSESEKDGPPGGSKSRNA